MSLGYSPLRSSPTFATTAKKPVASSIPIAGTRPNQFTPAPTNYPGLYHPGKDADSNYGLPLANAGGGQSGGGAPSYFQAPSFDWHNDPFLMQTMALTAQSRTAAEQQKNDALRKNILASGLDVMASKLFPGDQAFIDAVKNNTFGMNQQIAHTYEGQTGKVNQANEAMNQDNLFFSSYRTGQQLPEIYRQRQEDEYDLTNKTQESVDTVNAAYANKLQELQYQELQAQQAAWLSAMQMGASSGYGPSGGGGGGGFDAATGRQYDSPERGGRPGEYADLPVRVGWNPAKNSDAEYDMSGAQNMGGWFLGPNGVRYDENGRVI